jgi:hypothetical protein
MQTPTGIANLKIPGPGAPKQLSEAQKAFLGLNSSTPTLAAAPPQAPPTLAVSNTAEKNGAEDEHMLQANNSFLYRPAEKAVEFEPGTAGCSNAKCKLKLATVTF